MATSSNLIGIALEITADPSKAEAAIGQLEAQAQAFKAQMDALSTAMFQSPEQRTGAFAGQSYEDLSAQFGQAQQQWLALRDQIEQAQGQMQTFGETEAAAAGKAAQAASQTARAVKESGAAFNAAAEPVIVYDRAMRGANATAKNWEKIADAELAKLKETAAATGTAAKATQQLATSQAEGSTAAMTASERIVMLRGQYEALAAEVKRGQGLAFISPEAAQGLRIDREMMAQIKAEAVGMGASVEQAGRQGARGIMASLTNLREFRMLMYSTLGLLSVGFYISEWGRLAEWIGNAASSLGGFDAGYRQLMDDAVKANNALLVSFNTLNVAQTQRLGLIKDANQRQKQQLVYELQNAEANQQALTAQRKGLQEQIDLIRRYHDLQKQAAATALDPAAEWSARAVTQMMLLQNEAKAKNIDLTKDLADLQKAETQAEDNERKAGLAVVNLKVQLSDASDKQAASTKRATSSTNDFQKAVQSMQRAIEHATPTLPLLIQQLMALSRAEDAAVAKAQALKTIYQQSENYGQKLSGGLLSGLTPGQMPAGQFDLSGVVTPAMQAATKALDTQTKAQQAALRAQQQAYQRTAQIARESFSIMGEAVGQYGGTFGRVFSQVSRLVELMINLHRLESVSAVTAANAKAAAQASAVGKVSFVKSMFETAEGIAALARLDFSAAAQHFAASAKFLAVIGAVASVAGTFASMGGSGASVSAAAASSSSAAAPASTEDHTLASGASSAEAAAKAQQQTIQVIFQGPVYGGKAATSEIIDNINAAVKFDRKQLNASHNVTGKSLA